MVRKLTLVLLSGVICLLAATSILARVDQYNSPAEYQQLTGEKIEKFHEAPMLREKVAAGELPPVEERLPENPIIVVPWEEIGQYGGIIRVCGVGNELGADTSAVNGGETLLRYGSDGYTLLPNLAEDWRYSEDGKVLTLYLRKGVKWSDGAPFTVDDIMFWYEDVLQNEELKPAIPSWMKVGDELVKLERVDDYTIRFRFSIPCSWFAGLYLPTAYGAEGSAFFPKHYLKQFHPRYTDPDKIISDAKQAGFEYWYQLFWKKANYLVTLSENPDLPSVGPFKTESKGIDTLLLERNPYYWKVDPEGNQLPYIDGIHNTRVSNNEIYVGRVLTGEVDLAGWVTGIENYPLYAENAEKADYRMLIWPVCLANGVAYYFNLTIEDPILREIFQDVRFRRAMSLALDREEMVEVVYLGFAEPCQVTLLPTSGFYEPEFAKAYAQYDREEANRLLDEMGLKKRDKDGYRLRPDGERLSLLLEFWDVSPVFNTTNDLAVKYWKDVGVEVIQKGELLGALSQRIGENKFELSLIWVRGLEDGFYSSPTFVVPISGGSYGGSFAPLWGQWIESEGEKGEKPSEEIMRNSERLDKMKRAADREEAIRWGKELLRSQAENLWYIGTTMAKQVMIAKNNLRNLPPDDVAIWGGPVMNLQIFYPEQFFLKQK